MDAGDVMPRATPDSSALITRPRRGHRAIPITVSPPLLRPEGARGIALPGDVSMQTPCPRAITAPRHSPPSSSRRHNGLYLSKAHRIPRPASHRQMNKSYYRLSLVPDGFVRCSGELSGTLFGAGLAVDGALANHGASCAPAQSPHSLPFPVK